jgi:hypothetical protein
MKPTMRRAAFADTLIVARGATGMRGKAVIATVFLGAGALLVSGCDTMAGTADHLMGVWGGPHVGLAFQGGLADVQFDCASGTIDDAIAPGPGGSFSAKGTYRTGTGPVKVGQFFRSEDAVYSGQIGKIASKSAPRTMTLTVTFEEGTTLGPFTLTEGAPPQLTRCA